MSRRELLRTWAPALASGVALAGLGIGLAGRAGRHRGPLAAESGRRDWRRSSSESGRLVIAGGKGPAANLRRGMAALGGIERFVGAGEKVVIKPNCAWDRKPEQAANTNPDLVAELVRLCLAAGAASVVVADSTCHDADRSFERSGIGPAARAAGARVAHQGSGGTVAADLGGGQLGTWELLRPLAEADRVINVPLVKHHSLARATLGMKNWFGALVGNRSRLHQRLAQVTAELGAALKPTLTVMDATRVLTGGGPTGGSLSLVDTLDLIGVATDPVAADAWGGSLLGLESRRLPHLEIAGRLGLGTADWGSVQETI